MSLHEIIEMPTSLGNNHESLLRSYHALDYILKMVKRGDSNETILEVASFLKYHVNSKEKEQSHAN